MSERWNPMRTAPRDGTIIDVRHISKREGELIFRTRWLDPVKAWIDWDHQNVALSKRPLKGWRLSETQFRAWSAAEVAALTELHDDTTVRYLDPVAFRYGIRRVVSR